MAAMDRVAENLGRGMRMIAAALAPTEIVVVGEITSAWHTIGPKVELSLRQSFLTNHAFQTPLMGVAGTEPNRELVFRQKRA
jgi:predicted NBD/HSP70 family sugar kinase